MTIHPQIHAWLDAWEQRRGQQPCPSFDEFVTEAGRDAPAELVAAFRLTVQALNRIDGLLHRLKAEDAAPRRETS
jgi:hypothetical protein